jgi:hypothetical protein
MPPAKPFSIRSLLCFAENLLFAHSYELKAVASEDFQAMMTNRDDSIARDVLTLGEATPGQGRAAASASRVREMRDPASAQNVKRRHRLNADADDLVSGFRLWERELSFSLAPTGAPTRFPTKAPTKAPTKVPTKVCGRGMKVMKGCMMMTMTMTMM